MSTFRDWFTVFKVKKFQFGDQAVTQFVIFECKYLFSVVLFYFHKSNGSQDRCHTHAFNAISFKIFGRYTEYLFDGIDRLGEPNYRLIDRTEFIKFFPKNSIHKIGNSNGCLTLLFSGPWDKTWIEIMDNGKYKQYTWGRNLSGKDC